MSQVEREFLEATFRETTALGCCFARTSLGQVQLVSLLVWEQKCQYFIIYLMIHLRISPTSAVGVGAVLTVSTWQIKVFFLDLKVEGNLSWNEGWSLPG